MRRLYTALLQPVSAIAALAHAWSALRGDRALVVERAERRGFLPPSPDGPGPLWIQAASVGEVRLAQRLTTALRSAIPGYPVALSTTTRTGRALAEQEEIGARRFYFPLDVPAHVRRAIRRLAPRLFVSVETELWPNLLLALARRRIPAAVISGRISPRAFARYRRVRGALAPALETLALVAAASEVEAERFRALGVPAERLCVAGNLKFDLDGTPASPAEIREIRNAMGLTGPSPLLVAGSTGPREEALVLDAFAPLLARDDRPVLVIAPRHPERFDEAAAEIERRGWPWARRSRAPAAAETRVLLLDTLGELARLYAAARGVLVGGTLVPVGGHNLLEPAVRSVPVAFGPHTGEVAEMAAALLDEGAAARVEDPASLAALWDRWLDDPETARAMGERGRAFVLRHRGATAATVGLLAALVEPSRARSGVER